MNIIPTLLKMDFEGGVVLKFHFKIPFLQSCFLNDQHSSSFHVTGKQMKIKYLRLAPEELSTCQTEAAHRDGIPPKIALPSSYLRLAPPEPSASFLNQCPKLVKKCYFTIPFEGLDHYPRVSNQKKLESDRLVLSPRNPPL